MRSLLTILALVIFAIPAVAAIPSAQSSAGHMAGKMQFAANEQLPHKGKVLSSIDASIYTYIELSENGKTVWIAAPTIAVKKGDMVGFDNGAPMSNFYSKSLNRTFETVYFVGKAVVLKK